MPNVLRSIWLPATASANLDELKLSRRPGSEGVVDKLDPGIDPIVPAMD